MNSTWIQAAKTLEEMILEDPGNRGVRHFYIPRELERAAQALLTSRRVMILTGFYILAADAGESDGPPGAVVLARALKRMGADVLLVTDEVNEPGVRAAEKAIHADVDVHVFKREDSVDSYRALLMTWQPSHIVAVERPGRAADGRYYNMKAESICHATAQLDWLIILAEESGAQTIGLGDGGNEIGMGRVLDRVAAYVPHGEKIACIVPTDYLIAAGVTNWAAYALTALLSMATGEPLLHSIEEEEMMLREMTRVGCVDGNLCRLADSIDGISLDYHQNLISMMHRFIDASR